MKPAPMSDVQIDALFDELPDGAGGFLKTWGYKQFSQAIIAARDKQWQELVEKAQRESYGIASDLLLEQQTVRELRDQLAEYQKDAERLEFVMSHDAFLARTQSDAGATCHQLWSQNEDEDYTTLSGEGAFYNDWRAAIDAAMQAEVTRARNDERIAMQQEPVPPFGSKRVAAMAVYTPPFKYEHGYIFDSQRLMVADNGPICNGPSVKGAVASRVRGWGLLGYLPNGAELQDEIGRMMADALNQLYLAAGAQPQPVNQALLEALKECLTVLAANGTNFGKVAQLKARAAIAQAEIQQGKTK